MNSFESLIAMVLRREGFWVQGSYKVNLSREEKRAIGRPSSPRWEIDLLAYKAKTNTVRIIECKSWIDSSGIRVTAFDGSQDEQAAKFKLFNDESLQKIVVGRIIAQLQDAGMCGPEPKIELCVVCGRIRNETDRAGLQKLFAERQWVLIDEIELVKKLRSLTEDRYEDDVATVVAKLLLRKKISGADVN